MTAIIFAILTCTSGGTCLDNYPVRFHSARDCVTFLTQNMAHGQPLKSGRAYANGSRSVWFECDQKPTSEWQTVQPQPRAPEAKTYTIATCFKNEADAKTVAGPGGWKTGDAPCIQMQPVVRETKSGCLALLFEDAKQEGPAFAEPDVGTGRVYLHGKSHDVWMQCYQIGEP